MASIQLDKPRSITPEAICRDLRESKHCQGMEILLWDEEITVEDRKSGLELTIKLESSKVEVESGSGKKDLAERVATALVALGLRRRGLGKAKDKRPFPRRPTATPPAPTPSTPASPSAPTDHGTRRLAAAASQERGTKRLAAPAPTSTERATKRLAAPPPPTERGTKRVTTSRPAPDRGTQRHAPKT